MAVIDDYYPELVRNLLECAEDENPLVILVDKKHYDPREDEDPDDCPPHVSVMFPENSRIQELEQNAWFELGIDQSSEFGINFEKRKVVSMFEDEPAICLVLPLLNILAGLGENKTRDFNDWVFWNPVRALLDVMPDGGRLLIPVPIRLLRLPGLSPRRIDLFKNHRAFILEHQDPYCAIRFRMEGAHDPHRMATIVIWKEPGPIIFYRLKQPDLKDFLKRLPILRKGVAKQVTDGFVYDGNLSPRRPMLYEAYRPDQQPGESGGRLLSELAEIIRGPSLTRSMNGGRKCFCADCITSELIPDYGKLSRVENAQDADSMVKLQDGDLVLKKQTDGAGRLSIVFLESPPANTAFDDSVMVIRFKPKVPQATRGLAVDILRSPAAARVLFPEGIQPLHDLDPEWVKSMRLPLDEDVVADYLRILDIRQGFSSWTERAEQLLQGLLWEDTSESIRKRIQQGDKELRLIYETGESVGDPDHLIVRYYPRPLSYVWGEYRASIRSDRNVYYERIAKAKKAGEALVAFLALVGASYAHGHGHNILGGSRLSRNGKKPNKGFDLGKWISALDAACNKLKGISSSDPTMPNFGVFLNDKVWNNAVSHLRDFRNDDSHLRLSNPSLADIAKQIEFQLKIMYQKVEFLTNWSLRIVDLVKPDPRLDVSTVYYRELHGTMIHNETHSCAVAGQSIGPGFLYLVNKFGKQKWHLLDPFLKFMECPDHRFESIFHLDSLPENMKNPDAVVLRSFEFNSTRTTNEFNCLFIQCGMLNDDKNS